MRVIDDITKRIAVELQQVIADYWHDVDENRGLGAPDYFTEDCILYVGSDRTFKGRAGIIEFYRYRSDRGIRTTRHTCSNFRIRAESETLAHVSFIVANYASDGSPPITDLAGPALVSQVDCVCELGADRLWRFKSLRGDPIFIGKEPYTVAVLVDGQH